MTGFVHDLIAGKPPNALAVTDPLGVALTYADLAAEAAALATALERHGIRPGDRLLLVGENLAPFVVAALAASQIGAWLVPLNARMSPSEIAATAAHAGARASLYTTGSAAAAAHAAATGAAVIGNGLAISPIVANAQAEGVPDAPSERVATLLYTTGTTNRPKGVMLTHANLTWNAATSAALRGMTPDDTNLGVLPATHVFGYSSVVLASLYAGASLRLLPRFCPQDVVSALEDGVSVFCGVPQMFERLLAHLEVSATPVTAPRLKYLSAGGAPLDPDFKARTEATFGLPLNNGYGLTETSPSAAATDYRAARSDTAVGHPVPGADFIIDTPDADGVGELLIRSPGVMKGYYRDDDLTRAALLAGGWLRSGDLARQGEDGAFHIVGRTKELIIRSGFNVHPPEIEAMLTRHPGVGQAAVVGRPVGANEEVIAFVTGTADPATLTRWLSDRLVAYKVPQHIIVVDTFPTAATGKVLKHTLLTHFAARLPRVAA